MNLFLDVFARQGATTVELDEPVWESDFAPGQREVDFSGAGVRLGFRWI